MEPPLNNHVPRTFMIHGRMHNQLLPQKRILLPFASAASVGSTNTNSPPAGLQQSRKAQLKFSVEMRTEIVSDVLRSGSLPIQFHHMTSGPPDLKK